MSTNSAIEWTDATWNPVVGCARVSPGCEHCYAETTAARHVLMSEALGRSSTYLPVVDVGRRRWNRRAETVPARLADPLTWRTPRCVFVNSMSDLFHEDVPFDFIAAVFGVMAATPRHTYQILTKRPTRMLEFFAHNFGLEDTETTVNREGGERFGVIWDGRAPRGGWPKSTRPVDLYAYSRLPDMRTLGQRLPWVWPLPNVWLGVSVEDQRRADERIPLLLRVPAAIRFISAEPLLTPVTLRPRWIDSSTAHALDVGRLDWVIVGGESGPGARPMHEDWARSLRDQCAEAGVAFFFKQWGGAVKKKAGRLLDGREHNEFPKVVSRGQEH